MQRLFQQYKAIVATMLGFVFIFHYLAVKFLLPAFEEKTQHNKFLAEILIFTITGTGVYASLTFLPTKIYEKYGWKWLNRKYDFAGDWHVHVTFKRLERSGLVNPSQEILPDPYESIIEITQSFLSIEMGGFTHDCETWKSKIVNIIDEHELLMVYEVKRSASSAMTLPTRALGVEEITVVNRDHRGRPIELAGDFSYVAMPDIPLYRGVTSYKRISQWERQQKLNQMRYG